MAEVGHITEAEALRERTYVSERGHFIYRPCLNEFGTNKMHHFSQEMTRLILRGVDAYDQWADAQDTPHDRIKSSIHELVTGEEGKEVVVGLRMDNPMLIFEGLKKALDIPGTSTDDSNRIYDALPDFFEFVKELAYKDVLPHGSSGNAP